MCTNVDNHVTLVPSEANRKDTPVSALSHIARQVFYLFTDTCVLILKSWRLKILCSARKEPDCGKRGFIC